jgi:diaminohydroxyphosphoribosylaminopyrimidine deaminase/5-amino-6-(5-phosphoribosylamino)uracil reductase
MQRTLQLAENGKLHVAPNPMVGCVVVHNGKIIGEGFHAEYGKSHAEVQAIQAVKDKNLLKNSTLYVNLEPCSHHGKTPPCVDLLIAHKIPHVFVAALDPNPKVCGQGIAKLKQAGCTVEVGLLEEEAKALNKRFFCFHEKKRPYIILKWAQTLDGFMDCNERNAKSRESYWITNRYLKQKVHTWRAEEAAIFVGANTIIHDNPQLNVRYAAGKNPIRITLIDREIDFKKYHFSDNSQPTVIFYQERHCGLDPQSPANNGISYQVRNDGTGNNTFFYKLSDRENPEKEMLEKLHSLQIQSLLIEGGQRTLQRFIDLNLWDEARILVGNTCFGKGLKAPVLEKTPTHIEQVGEDKIVWIENEGK